MFVLWSVSGQTSVTICKDSTKTQTINCGTGIIDIRSHSFTIVIGDPELDPPDEDPDESCRTVAKGTRDCDLQQEPGSSSDVQSHVELYRRSVCPD